MCMSAAEWIPSRPRTKRSKVQVHRLIRYKYLYIWWIVLLLWRLHTVVISSNAWNSCQQEKKMWRAGWKGYGTEELEAVFGEQEYHGREWETEEKGFPSPPRESSFDVWVSDQIPSFQPLLHHPFSCSSPTVTWQRRKPTLSSNLSLGSYITVYRPW